MRNLIYYPSFEPESEIWLKYALIHFDRFSPIIPPTGKKEISDLFKRIHDKTNLIRIIQPENINGAEAGEKAIEEITAIAQQKSQYGKILGITNVWETWTNPINWNEVLYREKFNDDFLHFCRTEGLGEKHPDGLKLSPELCGLYMTFLAESIAYRNQAAPITDIKQLDDLSTYYRSKNIEKENMLNAARIVIETKLPTNIENIAIEKVIEFRNQDGINELRNSFNVKLEAFYQAIENDFDPFTFLNSLKKTNLELIKETTLFFGGLTSSVLGAVILTKVDDPSKLEILKESLGTGFSFGGVLGISSAWKLGSERKNARKFLTKLKTLE